MQYHSTRDNGVSVSAARAITQGISKEGGLFVPESFPLLTEQEIASLVDKSYVERATYVLSKYLTDFTVDEVKECAEAAYSLERFRDPAIAPLHSLNNDAHILELWHGPTCAFKDMALQILPHLLKKPRTAKKLLFLSQRPEIPAKRHWRVSAMLLTHAFLCFIPKTVSARCRSCKW